jgi:hypothetical protein
MMQVTLKRCAMFFIICSATGCFYKPFRPPPYDYEVWRKDGVTTEDVKKMILECGYPDLFASLKYAFGPDDSVAAARCMEYQGFEQIDNYYRWQSRCRFDPLRSLDVCAPNFAVPLPSRQRRVSSPYCRDWPKSKFCDGTPDASR